MALLGPPLVYTHYLLSDRKLYFPCDTHIKIPEPNVAVDEDTRVETVVFFLVGAVSISHTSKITLFFHKYYTVTFEMFLIFVAKGIVAVVMGSAML